MTPTAFQVNVDHFQCLSNLASDQMVNTAFTYDYMSPFGGSFASETVIVQGRASAEDLMKLEQALDGADGNGFIADKVMFDSLSPAGTDDEVDEDDEWHRLLSVNLTTEQATVEESVQTLIERFCLASDQGWES